MNNNDRIGDIRKALVPSIVAVIVLIGLVVGATWAFFTVKVDNKVTQTTASASTPEIPLVTLSGGVSQLSMSLTADDMASINQKTYYAGETGKVESQTAAPTIATVTLDKDKVNTYICSYTITAKASAENKSLISAYTSKSATNTGELVLKLNSTSYDLASENHNTAILNSGITNSGTVEVSANKPATLTAQFSLTNNNKDQSFIAETEATIDITAAITTCNLKTSA